MADHDQSRGLEPADGARLAVSAHASGISSRAVFLDLARAVAILMMIQGHTIDAVLVPSARAGTWFAVWSFLRGLTSCTFLMLSGVVFTIATLRHWPLHLELGMAVVGRLRRFTLFLVLGYALHFPVPRIVRLWQASDERWRSFLAVDILQLVAITLIGLQLLVLIARTPRRYELAAAAACALAVVLTPMMWAIDWSGILPLAAASYLSPATGSQFPLFPWSGYMLFGVLVGMAYLRAGPTALARFANFQLLLGGAAMVALAFLLAQVRLQPFGPTDFWTTSPNQFLLRAGLVLMLFGVAAHASRFVSHKPRIIHSLAQESLTIYAVHLVLVYGSIWNDGLRQRVGATLPGNVAVGYAALLWLTMGLFALAWHWTKRTHPRIAGWLRWALAGGLLYQLR
ncbi:MAG TPA: heparan-alpha-glucosaminide N-acetyltransferase domain-containing protein [Vicinamibacterales bacterium]|nr:heparan-alpha-glucosaminide N-acetyltransferase domain-containing protein [Vicinamibacterales bacterium]